MGRDKNLVEKRGQKIVVNVHEEENSKGTNGERTREYVDMEKKNGREINA